MSKKEIMENNNVYIVEDENNTLKNIQKSLKKLGYNIIGTSNNGLDAIKNITALEPNVVLMDINLKGNLTGIDVAETLKKNYNIPIIFLLDNTLEESFNVKLINTEPYACIFKPIKDIELKLVIELTISKSKKDIDIKRERDYLFSLVENKDESKPILFIKSNSKLIKLNLKDIYFIEALKDYVVVNTQNARYTVHSTMKEIEKKLYNGDFIRAHRSFIIRIDKIQVIENQTVILEENKKLIPIGGRFKEELLTKINMI